MTSTSLIDLVKHDWKEIDLPNLRSTLDSELESLYTQSEESKQQRRDLAKATKELKSSSDADKLRKLGSVLKLYQRHIDREGKRCKEIETAFLRVYKVVTDAPDPVDALNEAQKRILESQKAILEAEDARMQLQSYQKEFQVLKNQEITVRTLQEAAEQHDGEVEKYKEQVSAMERSYEELEAVVAAVNAERAQLEVRMEQMRKERVELQTRVEETNDKLFSKQNDLSQLTEVRDDSQLMLEEELEMTQAKLAQMRRENGKLLQDVDELKKKMKEEKLAASAAAGEGGKLGELKKRLKDARAELKEAKSSAREETERVRSELRKEHAHGKRILAQLETAREDLSMLPTPSEYRQLVDKVKVLQEQFMDSSQLRTNSNDVWKSQRERENERALLVADGSGDQELDDGEENNRGTEETSRSDAVSADANASLEVLFYQKNRKMEKEITRLRLELYEKSDALQEASGQLEELTESVAQKDKQLQRLENDLAQMSSMKENESGARGRMMESDMEEKKREDSFSNGQRDSEAVSPSGSSSAFAIVCEQRDRLREKCQKLELTLIATRKERDQSNSVRESLKRENLELFKKIKYLENWQQMRRRSSASVSGNSSGGKVNLLGAPGDARLSVVERKYAGLYEEQMNPFSKFEKMERQQRIDKLSWTEWVAFLVGSTILSRKTLRAFAVFYAILLHLLTFFVLWHEFKSHGLSPDCTLDVVMQQGQMEEQMLVANGLDVA